MPDFQIFKGNTKKSREISERILTRLNIEPKEEILYVIENHDTPIDTNSIKNRELEIKRLKVQYADAYAHSPSTIQKRILRLNAIKELRSIENRSYSVSGMSSMVLDTMDLSEKEITVYIVIAVALCLLILELALDSYIVPVLLLANPNTLLASLVE